MVIFDLNFFVFCRIIIVVFIVFERVGDVFVFWYGFFFLNFVV